MTKYNDDDIIWRTIGGRRIPIRKGQSLSDAMKESGKFKKSKTEVKDEQKKFEESKEDKKDYKSLDNYEVYDEAMNIAESTNDSELRSQINKQLDKIDRANKRGEGYSDKATNELRDILEKNSNKDSDYELYKKAKDNPESIDPMTENSTDWEALDKKYSKKYNDEANKEFHFAGEELYSDDPNRFGDTLRKHNEKMNPSKSRDDVVKQLDNEAGEVKNNKIPRDFEKGYGKFKTETNMSKNLDDRYEITKDEYGEYHAKNLRTGETYATSGNTLRNGNVFEFEDSKSSESNWKSEDGGVTRRETDKGTNYIQGTKKADGTSEYTRTDYDKKGNEISSKTYKSLDEAKNEDSDWRKQIESNNAQMEKDVTDLQNKINEYRTKSAQSNDALERYQYLKEAERLQNKYYERFRENERANAKLKKEEPNEKYMQVDAHATYKDKFNETWGEDGSNDKVVSASMYTNDEFMEHLEDSNWHSERRQLLDANLTNQELKYIKDRTKVSAWGVENLTGKEQVSQLIKEAKDKYKSSSINDNIRRKAYQKYLKEHPNSKMKFEDFKDMRKQ